MKRLIVALALAVALPGCGSLAEGKLRLGGGKTDAPTVEQVMQILRAEDEQKAREFLAGAGIVGSPSILIIAAAKEANQKLLDECLGQETCGR